MPCVAVESEAWRGHHLGLLQEMQHGRDCSSVFFTFHRQITAEKSVNGAWSYSLTALHLLQSIVCLCYSSPLHWETTVGVKCSASWEEKLGEVIMPEQGAWFYGKQAITVFIFYTSLHEPFIYSAPRKIFPSNTLLPNTFSMQAEITYFLTYYTLLEFLYVWLHGVLCCFMGRALTYVFSCNSSVQVSHTEIFQVKLPCEFPV